MAAGALPLRSLQVRLHNRLFADALLMLLVGSNWTSQDVVRAFTVAFETWFAALPGVATRSSVSSFHFFILTSLSLLCAVQNG